MNAKPALTLLRIPAGDVIMVGRMFTPKGQGPHPTVVLLHGFPGTQQNHDLATVLQEKGYNAVVFSYRGAWGSQGNFSYANALQDVQSALAYLRTPEVAELHRIDPERIALVGHSMGGFLACLTMAVDQGVKACVSLAGFNFGLVASLLEENPDRREEFLAMLNNSVYFLNGITGQELLEQMTTYQDQWNLLNHAEVLGQRPFLLIGGEQDDVGPVPLHHTTLAEKIEQTETTKFKHLTLDTDHNFVDKRFELAGIVMDWLDQNL